MLDDHAAAAAWQWRGMSEAARLRRLAGLRQSRRSSAYHERRKARRLMTEPVHRAAEGRRAGTSTSRAGNPCRSDRIRRRAALGRARPRRQRLGVDLHGLRAVPGFEPMPSYPEYSADFFDGQHYVMKGASPATAQELIRPSFRNWFRRNYPYVYAKFRTVACTMTLDSLAIDPLDLAAVSPPTCARDLALTPKQLQSKYLYDALGSSLFEAICRLPWYRITRAETRAARTPCAGDRRAHRAAPATTTSR